MANGLDLFSPIVEEDILGQPQTDPTSILAATQEKRRKMLAENPDLQLPPSSTAGAVTRQISRGAEERGLDPFAVAEAQEAPLSPLELLIKQTAEGIAESQKKKGQKAKAIGPDLFGSGGLLGTGIEPIDALLFTAGGLLTRRLPQEQAFKTTMSLVDFPKALIRAKEGAADRETKNLLSTLNAATGAGQLELSKEQQETKVRAKAAFNRTLGALEPGEGLEAIPFKVLAQGVVSGVLPPSVLTPAGQTSTTVQEVSRLDEQGNRVNIKGLFNNKTGELISVLGIAPEKEVSAEGIPTGTLSDSLVTRKTTPKMQAAGFDATTEEGRVKIGAAVDRRKAAETARIAVMREGISAKQRTEVKEFVKEFTLTRTAIEQLDRIDTLFRKTPAFRRGSISDLLRASLVTNEDVRFVDNLLSKRVPLGPDKIDPNTTGAYDALEIKSFAGFTKEEKDFAAAYNALIIKLRSFSGDPRFSDQDAVRTLRGIGTALLGGDFPRQLAETKRFLLSFAESSLDLLEAVNPENPIISRFQKELGKFQRQLLLPPEQAPLPPGKKLIIPGSRR